MKNDEVFLQDAALFAHRMSHLSKALWKAIEKDWQEWIKPFHLNINEHHILFIAHHLKGASISEIAKFGVMHVSTAFNFSKNLEERGLLSFSKREDDKRNTYVKLTDEGTQLLIETINRFDATESVSIKGVLPLTKVYGKFPEMIELTSMVKGIYGEEYMKIFNRTIESIKDDFDDENQSE